MDARWSQTHQSRLGGWCRTPVAASASRRLLAIAACLAMAASACGGEGAGASAGCDRPVEVPAQNPQHHLLPGAPEPSYTTDPPTSGPHIAVPATLSVSDDPLPPPLQVGVLHAGRALAQHQGLQDADREALEALAGDSLVVAPGDDLAMPIVLTAWRVTQECESLDVAAIERFVVTYRSDDPHG